MEFKFNLNDVLKGSVVEINQNLIPPDFTGDRRALWDCVGKVTEVVNAIGNASAAAQGLTKPITTADRLRNSDHKLYLLKDENAANGKGEILGMLKVGRKGLYVFDRDGQAYQVTPPCVLDFYIHESRQRAGLGKHLFEHMLQKENVEPVKLAIDRPSDKFLGFLNKHYGLNEAIKQMNNFVVFDGFFPEPTNKAKSENNNSTTPKRSPTNKQSANGLQTNFTSPYGRYGAPRPPCSMGQIIHNQTSTVQSNQEPTGNAKTTASEPVVQSQQMAQSSPPMNVTQSAPNFPQNYQQQQQQQQQLDYQQQPMLLQNLQQAGDFNNNNAYNMQNALLQQPNHQQYQMMMPQQYPSQTYVQQPGTYQYYPPQTFPSDETQIGVQSNVATTYMPQQQQQQMALQQANQMNQIMASEKSQQPQTMPDNVQYSPYSYPQQQQQLQQMMAASDKMQMLPQQAQYGMQPSQMMMGAAQNVMPYYPQQQYLQQQPQMVAPAGVHLQQQPQQYIPQGPTAPITYAQPVVSQPAVMPQMAASAPMFQVPQTPSAAYLQQQIYGTQSAPVVQSNIAHQAAPQAQSLERLQAQVPVRPQLVQPYHQEQSLSQAQTSIPQTNFMEASQSAMPETPNAQVPQQMMPQTQVMPQTAQMMPTQAATLDQQDQGGATPYQQQQYYDSTLNKMMNQQKLVNVDNTKAQAMNVPSGSGDRSINVQNPEYLMNAQQNPALSQMQYRKPQQQISHLTAPKIPIENFQSPVGIHPGPEIASQ